MRASRAEVDLGVCRAWSFDQGAERWLIVLPGAGYGADAPLLWFARGAALAQRLNVVSVDDTFDRRAGDPSRWVEARLNAAIQHVADPRPALVAKSLTTLSSPIAARLGLAAVWLTPLINPAGTSMSAAVVDGLKAATAPSLLIGGMADPSWDGVLARTIPIASVMEIPGADHSLQVPSDVEGSLDALRDVARAIGTFLSPEPPTETTTLSGLDHVQLAMPVKGEDLASQFYGELLALTRVSKPSVLARRGGCWFIGRGIDVHIGADADFRPQTKAHVALLSTDLAALRGRLEAAGVAVNGDDAPIGAARIYANDPFGNRLEFVDASDRGFTRRGDAMREPHDQPSA